MLTGVSESRVLGSPDELWGGYNLKASQYVDRIQIELSFKMIRFPMTSSVKSARLVLFLPSTVKPSGASSKAGGAVAISFRGILKIYLLTCSGDYDGTETKPNETSRTRVP